MKSVLLIGLDHLGFMMARKLHELGHEIMAVDKDETRVNAVLPFVTDAQIGDSTNASFLDSLDIPNYDVCIVTIADDFQSSLETTSLLKELGGKLVVSCAEREVQAKFLLRNGADEVIETEKQIAEWAAIRYASDHILDYIKLDEDHAIFEVPMPRDWVDKSIGQIDIRKKYGINIMAVKKNGQMIMSITPDMVLDGEMSLLVLGERKAIQKCFKM